MSITSQQIKQDPYTIIPRTLAFVFHDNQVLMIQYNSSKGSWAGRFNGIGGHLFPGESVLTCARRELLEETGIDIDNLQICGTVLIDRGETPGIGLYITAAFIRLPLPAHKQVSDEGTPAWIQLEELASCDLMEDVPQLIELSLQVLQGKRTPFSGLYRLEEDGVQIHFD
jgi:8-oxo-dGTP diphosphatase